MGNLVRMPLCDVNAGLEKLEYLGVEPEHWVRLRKDEEYLRGVANAFLGVRETDVEVVQPTPGIWQLSVEDVERHFGVTYSAVERQQLGEVPWSQEELEACKDTHILFPGYPLSILDIRSRVDRELFYSHKDAWYNGQAFAQEEKVGFRWYLMRRDIVHRSTSKTYQSQLNLLQKNEENPRACEVTYMVHLYYQATKIRLLENVYARCCDLSSSGYRVLVGGFDSGGFGVSGGWDVDRSDYVGVAASRKLPEV